MLRQYARTGACRYRYEAIGGKQVAVGTVPIGTIIYLNSCQPMRGLMDPITCREPWILDAWCGQPGNRHLAVMRSLRTGRTKLVADWVILYCVDAGLDFQKEPWSDTDVRQETCTAPWSGVAFIDRDGVARRKRDDVPPRRRRKSRSSR